MYKDIQKALSIDYGAICDMGKLIGPIAKPPSQVLEVQIDQGLGMGISWSTYWRLNRFIVEHCKELLVMDLIGILMGGKLEEKRELWKTKRLDMGIGREWIELIVSRHRNVRLDF